MAGADLDEESIGSTDPPDNLADDPVFAVLREDLRLEVGEVARISVAGRLEQLQQVKLLLQAAVCLLGCLPLSLLVGRLEESAKAWE